MLVEAYFEDAEAGRHRPNARPKRNSTLAMERAYFARLIAPKFGRLPVAELGRHELQRFLDEVGKSTKGGARHCRNIIRQAYNYGIRHEIVERNPAQLTSLPAEPSRERVLSDEEVRRIWAAADKPGLIAGLHLAPGTGLAIQLAMTTLQRAEEVCGLHAREIDMAARLWTIPGTRTKNYHTHVVPLSSLALSILERAGALAGSDGYVFPSPLRKGPITRHAFSRAMSRVVKASGIADARLHDFRRTGSTKITGEKIRIPRFVVSRVLNQLGDTGGAAIVTAVYDRNEYLFEKRRALEAWASALAEVLTSNRSPQQVPPSSSHQ